MVDLAEGTGAYIWFFSSGGRKMSHVAGEVEQAIMSRSRTFQGHSWLQMKLGRRMTEGKENRKEKRKTERKREKQEKDKSGNNRLYREFCFVEEKQNIFWT